MSSTSSSDAGVLARIGRSRIGRGLAVAAAVVSIGLVVVAPGGVDAQSVMSDREAIGELQARYFRLLDQKDWVGFRALLADDIRVDLTADQLGTFDDADTFVAAMADHGVTVHQGHMPEIAVASADEATAIWAIEDVDRRPTVGGASVEAHAYGHAHVAYGRIGGEWKVTSLTVTRLRTDLGG